MENCARRAQNCARVAQQYFTSSAWNDVAIWKVDDLFVRIGKASEFAAFWIMHHLSVPHWCAFTLDIDISKFPRYSKIYQTWCTNYEPTPSESRFQFLVEGCHHRTPLVGDPGTNGHVLSLRRSKMSTTSDICMANPYILNLCSDSLLPRTRS